MFYVGKKVRLRPSEREDIPQFVTWLSNPELRHYVTVRYVSEALEERWFEGMVQSAAGRTPSRLHFVIETLDTGQPIGVVGLEDIDWLDRCAEFGIIVGEPEFWGLGYGSDALRVLLEVGFHWYNLHRIFLRVVAANQRAIRSYEKCGFHLEGRLREATFIDGTYHDLLIMSVLSHEYDGAGRA
ncbi:MAG: GNAT family N-acetyltransferase [Anaerolineae bacterium]|nr:GNAT family N-acetyltransferase [Anaerolineae bacterium]